MRLLLGEDLEVVVGVVAQVAVNVDVGVAAGQLRKAVLRDVDEETQRLLRVAPRDPVQPALDLVAVVVEQLLKELPRHRGDLVHLAGPAAGARGPRLAAKGASQSSAGRWCAAWREPP